MKLTPEDLSASSFNLLLKIEFSELSTNISKNWRSLNGYMICYHLYNALLVSFLVLYFIKSALTGYQILQKLIISVALSVTAMVIIHEAIHGIWYKFIGAQKIVFGVDWNALIFFSAADKFVVNGIDYIKLALSPFIISNFFFISTSVIFTSLIPILIPLAFFHNINCFGDFCFLSFVHKHKASHVYTYDDVEKKTSYFYIKQSVTY